jgi:hypothetical protein
LTNSRYNQTNFKVNQEESEESIGPLSSASNARDQVAIIAGQLHGVSVLLAFDEAWNEAAQAKSK